MKDKRPDPDQLLKAVSKELNQEGRGRLKIFLGAYAGVGKNLCDAPGSPATI
jgi:K+-sensing histidine kinase KdpD